MHRIYESFWSNMPYSLGLIRVQRVSIFVLGRNAATGMDLDQISRLLESLKLTCGTSNFVCKAIVAIVSPTENAR